jgi:SAM-dependent methyltransferase
MMIRSGASDIYRPRQSDASPVERDDAEYFDALYAEQDDPWGLRSSWYERRKRALSLAMLPRAHYARAFEPGCGIGELTAELASHCASVTAWDISARGLAIARRKVDLPHVQFERNVVPEQWPQGDFDLVVISELAYYLSGAQLRTLALLLARSLVPGGTVLACHWRRAIHDARTSAVEAHQTIADVSGLICVAHYDDDDMIIDVWSDNPRSVAKKERASP